MTAELIGEASRPERETAGREVRLFLALLMALSGVFYGLLLFVEGTAERWLSYSAAFMWCPAVAALLTRWWVRRNVRGLGWRWGGARYYLVAFLLPLAFAIPVYAAVWWWGWGEFDPTRLEALRGRIGLPANLVGSGTTVLALLLAAPLGMVNTLGEEIGWRGFLVPRLAVFFDLRRTSLLIGLLWALWHYPLIFLVVPLYFPTLPLGYATACFTIMVVAISGVYTWLRVRSGSVFPAALLHATSNAFVMSLEGLTRGTELTPYITHEYGIGLAITIPLVAWPFWRGLRPGGASEEGK